MKSKLMLVLFAVFFSLFLFLGIKASQSVFSDGDRLNPKAQYTRGPVLIEEQQGEPLPEDPFILVIYVDDLSKPDPLLEGVWLSRSGDVGQIKLFFPIFPSQAEDGIQRDLNLRGAFWLDEPTQLSDKFLTILRDRNLSWNQIFLIDQAALFEIGLILQETKPESYQLDLTALSNLSYGVDFRVAVQQNQALYIQEICQQLPLPGQNELLQRFLEGFSGHILLIGTTPLEFNQSWQGDLSCLFPTLSLAGE
ncbi:MAG: hypothetical protein MUO54_03675 [Anaerolineales bacterium]|nr:hypothetical protein [Anaerolineales bacterium]